MLVIIAQHKFLLSKLCQVFHSNLLVVKILGLLMNLTNVNQRIMATIMSKILALILILLVLTNLNPSNIPSIILSSHNDYLDSQIKLNSTLAKLAKQMTSFTSFFEIACKNFQKKQEEKQLEEEQAANAQTWKLPVCYDDDDDEERSNSLKDNIISGLPPCSAITLNEPVLSTEEPDNSLSMGDEHLDTILTKSDEVIKSSVGDLIPIPRESEGIHDHMCDVPFHDNSPPLDVSKDQIEDFSESNDEFSSIDDDSFSFAKIDYVEASPPDSELDFSESNKEFSLIDDDSFSIDTIDYVEASPPASELVSSEVMEIVISEVGGIDDEIFLTIKDDVLREKLRNVNLLIFKIEALNANPTPSSDCKTKSSSTSLTSLLEETNTFDNSLPEFETFCFDVEEISSGKISSGSPTTHSDSSLYASFMFDLSINPFPPADRSDSYEFTDELIPFISAPEYDYFRFKDEPNSRDFTKDVVENISSTKEPQVLTALPTHPTLHPNMKFRPSSESLFSYINEDIIFDPGICKSTFSKPDLSYRRGTVKKFNTHRSHLNKCPMLFDGQNNPILDVLLFHFYPP
nr:hypothetical protein [Tanacetum cinerariifolium]